MFQTPKISRAREVPLAFLGNAGPVILTIGDQQQEILAPESDRHQLQLEDFAAAIMEKRPPLLTPEETLRKLELIDRLYAAR